MVTMLDYVEWMVATSLRLSGSAVPYVFDGFGDVRRLRVFDVRVSVSWRSELRLRE
jgi:hypothetical protein